MNLREQINKTLNINYIKTTNTNQCQFIVEKFHNRYQDRQKTWRSRYFNRMCLQNLNIFSYEKINETIIFVECICQAGHLVKRKLYFDKRWYLINIKN